MSGERVATTISPRAAPVCTFFRRHGNGPLMVNALGGKRLLESFIFGIALDTMQLGSNAWHSWYDWMRPGYTLSKWISYENCTFSPAPLGRCDDTGPSYVAGRPGFQCADRSNRLLGLPCQGRRRELLPVAADRAEARRRHAKDFDRQWARRILKPRPASGAERSIAVKRVLMVAVLACVPLWSQP